MKYGLFLAGLLACAAQAQTSKPQQAGNQEAGSVQRKKTRKAQHEAGEDKARTVPGGASVGIKRCHKDIERFCAGVKPGEGRLGECLKAHADKLSQSCKRWLSHGGEGHVDRAFQELDKPAEKSAGQVK